MRLMGWTALWIFLLDQASKLFVLRVLKLDEVGVIEVLPPFLTFRMAWNRGVNFGLFSSFDMRWVLIGLAIVIIGFVLYWIRRDGGTRWTYLSAGLLIGGALGNVVDRVFYGAVADFLNMSCCGIYNPFAFNVADVWIFVGAFGLIFFSAPQNSKKGA